MNRKHTIIQAAAGYLGSFMGLVLLVLFNGYVLMSLPLALRMAAMIVTYWLVLLVPAIIMLAGRDKLTDYGFSSGNILRQIAVGLLIAAGMSLVLTLIPHLLGFGEYFDSGKRYQQLWQFGYEFIYCIAGVGLAEEFVFRGFLYAKIKSAAQSETAAVVISSVAFGMFHIMGGNIMQAVLTAFIGAIFCLCRLKIRNCTLLSLIIAHGVYDAMITVWSSLL